MSEPAPHALHGLYGGRVAREARANTVKSMTGTGARPQEVYTPQSVVDALLTFWGEIDLDPCSGPESIVPATTRLYGTPYPDGKRVRWEGEGLIAPWNGRTYVNSPFVNLGEWMGKITDERAQGRCEIIQMTPVRTQRKWWRSAARTAAHACWLDSNFKFMGYDQNAPFPLALLYYGERSRSDFRAAFGHLGDVSEVHF